MERVERAAFRTDARGARDAIPVEFAREMAEKLDALAERKTDDEVIVTGTGASVQRVWEDAEVGRLLRELAADGSSEVGVYRHGDSWIAWRDPRAWESSTRDASGPTRLAALRALRDAIGGEGRG